MCTKNYKGLNKFKKVGALAIKDNVIRVRVSKEQNELFKRMVQWSKVSMSEFMVVATEERALKEKRDIRE